MNYIKLKENYKIYLIISILLSLLFIISIFLFYVLNVNFGESTSGLDFIQIILGIITLFGGVITVILLFLRDKHTRTQIEHTQEQINIQDKSRKDQQFLDAIKLIEEDSENPKLGGLNILENLAKTDENYRQRILEYLSTHTIKLKPIVEGLKLEGEKKFCFIDGELLDKDKEFENIGFMNEKLYLEDTDLGLTLIRMNKYRSEKIKIENRNLTSSFSNLKCNLEVSESLVKEENVYFEIIK